MHFDWSINIGTIVSMASTIGLFIKFYIANVERLVKIETKVDTLWAAFNRSRRSTD